MSDNHQSINPSIGTDAAHAFSDILELPGGPSYCCGSDNCSICRCFGSHLQLGKEPPSFQDFRGDPQSERVVGGWKLCKKFPMGFFRNTWPRLPVASSSCQKGSSRQKPIKNKRHSIFTNRLLIAKIPATDKKTTKKSRASVFSIRPSLPPVSPGEVSQSSGATRLGQPSARSWQICFC